MRGHLFGLVASILLGATSAFHCCSAEPTYDGTTLSDWLAIYAKAKAQSNDVGQARLALRSIGTNAIPYLLDWGNTDKQQPLSQSYLGFKVLGPAATPAIRTLSKRLFGTNDAIATVAAKSLEAIGAPALPTLLGGFTNRYAGIQTYGPFEHVDLKPYAKSIMPSFLNDLENSHPYFRWRGAQGLGNLRLEPEKIVPRLATLLKDQDATVRYSAIDALDRFGILSIQAMPAISNALSDSDSLVRYSAIDALGKFGTLSIQAMPAISNALSDSDILVRLQATNTLRKIAETVVLSSGQVHPHSP